MGTMEGKPEEAGHVVVKTQGIERYWRELAGAGDPYLSLYEEARLRTRSSTNFANQNRFYSLYQMVNWVLARGIAGDMAECGCWRGHSTYIISSLLKKANWSNRLSVFDSFEGGLSDKVEEDRAALGDTSPERTTWQKQKFASGFEDVRDALSPFDFVDLYKGWIPDSFRDLPDAEEKSYSLVHIDVDLYQPTKASLEFFQGRMSTGGVIVIDDYGSANFPGSKVAVDEHLARNPPTFFIENHLIGAIAVY